MEKCERELEVTDGNVGDSVVSEEGKGGESGGLLSSVLRGRRGEDTTRICRKSEEAREEAEGRQTYANLPKRAPVAQRPPVASKKAEAAPTARPYLLYKSCQL